jgi:hypothetical protein
VVGAILGGGLDTFKQMVEDSNHGLKKVHTINDKESDMSGGDPKNNKYFVATSDKNKMEKSRIGKD